MSTHTQLSFDGFGINDADEYRTRLATFAAHVPDARRKELGALWVAAPAMLEALNSAVDELNIDGTYSATELMATIETVRANLREAIRLAEGEGVV